MRINLLNNKTVMDTISQGFIENVNKFLAPKLVERFGEADELLLYEDYLTDGFLNGGVFYCPFSLIKDGGARRVWCSWRVSEPDFEGAVPYSYCGAEPIAFEICAEPPVGFEERLAGRALMPRPASIPLRIEAASTQKAFLAGKYSQSFVDVMREAISRAIEAEFSIGKTEDSSLELTLSFMPASFMEHVVDASTYRRLRLSARACAPRDLWVKWTRLDGRGSYSVSDHVAPDEIRFELPDEVPEKIKEKEYRYLINAASPEAYRNAMTRKSFVEWRELVKRVIKRGEVEKHERIASPEEDEAAPSAAPNMVAEQEAETPAFSAAGLSLKSVLESYGANEPEEEREQEDINPDLTELLRGVLAQRPSDDEEEPPFEPEEENEEELPFESEEENEEESSFEPEEEDEEEAPLEPEKEDEEEAPLEPEEEDEEEPPFESEEEDEEDSPFEIDEEAPLAEAAEMDDEEPPFDIDEEERGKVETKSCRVDESLLRTFDHDVVERAENERLKCELRTLQEENARLRAAAAEQEKERERLEALLEKQREQEEERRREAEELRETLEASRRAEERERDRIAEAARLAVEEQRRINADREVESELRREEERRIKALEERKAAEAAERERAEREAEAQRLREKEAQRLREEEAQRLREEEAQRLREEEEKRREREEAERAAREAAKPREPVRYISKTADIIFRSTVDPNVTKRIQEIIVTTVKYFGKEDVYMKIRATIPEPRMVRLDFVKIPENELKLLTDIIRVLGHSKLGIVRVLLD